jgi:hypothetical protein
LKVELVERLEVVYQDIRDAGCGGIRLNRMDAIFATSSLGNRTTKLLQKVLTIFIQSYEWKKIQSYWQSSIAPPK